MAAKNSNSSATDKELVLSFEYRRPSLFWRLILIFVGIFLIAGLAAFIWFYLKFSHYLQDFSQAAKISQEEILNTAQNSLNRFKYNYNHLDQLPKQSNFLLLGTDQVSGREGEPELTDTILLLQLDTQAQLLKTLALPRDLYNQPYQTKINALYQYGKERYPEEPERFPTEVIAEMTGVQIDHSVVLNINDLEELIDILGGIEVDVPVAFTDPQFPRENVDVSQERDPAVLYKEVSFALGPQHMDGQRALEYMRSRHAEGDEGTDLARSQRQQLVIAAMLDKLEETRSATTLGKLYRFYLDHFANYLSLEEIIDLLTPAVVVNQEWRSPSFTLQNQQLSIYPEQEDGLLLQPPTWQTQGLWVYQIRDQEKFSNYLQSIFAVQTTASPPAIPTAEFDST